MSSKNRRRGRTKHKITSSIYFDNVVKMEADKESSLCNWHKGFGGTPHQSESDSILYAIEFVLKDSINFDIIFNDDLTKTINHIFSWGKTIHKDKLKYIYFEKINPVMRCPVTFPHNKKYPVCTHPVFLFPFIKNHLSGDSYQRALKIINTHIDKFLAKKNMIIYCPIQGCNGAENGIRLTTTIDKLSTKIMTCDARNLDKKNNLIWCNTSWCTVCDITPFHFGSNCSSASKLKKYAKNLQDKKLRESTIFTLKTSTFCPTCIIPISKLEGCDHMKCTCGTHFCYKCGEELPQNGGYGGHLTTDHQDNYICKSALGKNYKQFYLDQKFKVLVNSLGIDKNDAHLILYGLPKN